MLQVRNLMVFYENALAINDFSMEIAEREIIAVIGSNSAGKTTLMNTVSGLLLNMQIKEKRRGGERITLMGSVEFRGEDITSMPAYERVRRGIVLCRERHPIFPESDVVENLRIAGYLSSRANRDDMIDYVFHIFPTLTPLRKRKAGFLSGGEQQMLSVGMALVVNPTLLLLDEPLLGLSPAMQSVLIKAIKTVRDASGVTIVISEQFARPILPMIERGYVIENGMLSLSGAGQELMDNPEVKSAYFGI